MALCAIFPPSTPPSAVDIYKLESPARLADVPDPDGAEASGVQALYDRLAENLDRPWVLLSAGAGSEDFARALTYAYRAGASGYLCGRAIWASAFERFPDFAAMDRVLVDEALPYLDRINVLTDGLASPWPTRAGSEGAIRILDAGPGFPGAYAAPMTAELRQREILSLVERRGYMPIDALASHFRVTPQTIRRDINVLCERKLLARQHGGASLPSSVVNTSYSVRHVEQAAEKEQIARALVAHLPDHASLFISLGTTVEGVARALSCRVGLKIVTNNPEVARIASAATDFEVILTGGTVQRRNGGLVGDRALAAVASLRCDFAVLGIGAIEPDGALLDYHSAEVAVMRAMIEKLSIHHRRRRPYKVRQDRKRARYAPHLAGRSRDGSSGPASR